MAPEGVRSQPRRARRNFGAWTVFVAPGIRRWQQTRRALTPALPPSLVGVSSDQVRGQCPKVAKQDKKKKPKGRAGKRITVRLRALAGLGGGRCRTPHTVTVANARVGD